MIDPPMVRGAVHAVRTGARRRTARLRPLPDFLIIGGQRCGTTSLYHYLRAHPQVLPAVAKEVHFLSLHWTRGEGWYRAQFPLRARKNGRRANAPLTFEATPYYLLHPLAASRAHELVPDVKLLVLLRDPVARAWSHYRHMVRLGLEHLSFQEAIEQEPVRLAGEVERIRSDARYDAVPYRRYSYLTRGAYAGQLQQWLEHFPPDRFLVLRSERLLADPARSYARVLAFLGLPAWTPSSFPIHTRRSPVPPVMPADVRRRLEEHFAPATRQLEELLRRTGLEGSSALPVTGS
jgi:Sulfotransferase domain